MKILLTGYTAAQVNAQSGKSNFTTAAQAMVIALNELGHDVVNATVQPDTDLFEYDRVVVGYFSPSSMGAHRGLVLSPKLGAAIQKGLKPKFYIDDWHLSEMKTQTKTHIKDSNYFRLAKLMGYFDKPGMQAFLEDPANLAAKNFFYRDFMPTATLFTFMQSWSMHRGMVMAQKTGFGIVPWDPTELFNRKSAFWTPYGNVSTDLPSQREHKWLVACRFDVSEWVAKLGLTWPHVLYGHKRSGTEWVATEYELVKDVMAKYPATLSTAYSRPWLHGMWRVRFLHSIWARTVLVPTPEEIDGLPESSPYNITAQVVEAASPAQLDQLAVDQAAELEQRMWSHDRVLTAVEEFIN